MAKADYRCPTCDTRLTAADVNIAEGIAACKGCGAEHRLRAIVDSCDRARMVSAVVRDEPPEGCWASDDGKEFVVHASTRSVLFAFILTLASVQVVGSLLFAGSYVVDLTRVHAGEPALWWWRELAATRVRTVALILWWIFLGVFASGLAMLAWRALVAWLGYIEVRVTATTGRVRLGVFGLDRSWRFNPKRVRSVRVAEDVAAGDKSHFVVGRKIVLLAEERLEFGRHMNEERRKFMATKLAKRLVPTTAGSSERPLVQEMPTDLGFPTPRTPDGTTTSAKATTERDPSDLAIVDHLCPACESPIARADTQIESNVALCRACGRLNTIMSLINWRDRDAYLAAARGVPPRGCRLITEQEAIIVTARLPLPWLAFVFCALWNAMVLAFVTLLAVSTLAVVGITFPSWPIKPAFSRSVTTLGDAFHLWLFITPFILCGNAALLIFLFSLLGQYQVRLGRDVGELYLGVGGCVHQWRFDPRSVINVVMAESIYTSEGWSSIDGPPARAKEVRLVREMEGPFNFGWRLDDSAKRWIAGQLTLALMAQREGRDNSAVPIKTSSRDADSRH